MFPQTSCHRHSLPSSVCTATQVRHRSLGLAKAAGFDRNLQLLKGHRDLRRSYSLRYRHALASTARPPGTEEVKEYDVLVGDIGGTNCRLQLWKLHFEKNEHELLFQKIYKTKDYNTFEDALRALAEEDVYKKHVPLTAAIACAGPVIKNKCIFTNLGWVIDGNVITKEFGIKTAVLNDFQAVGYGVPALDPKDIVTLNEGDGKERGPKVVLGPGTGLGQAQLFWSTNYGGYRVWPSEGAHGTFAARGWKQRALQAFTEAELGFCEWEGIVCGSGLERIYRFLLTDPLCRVPGSPGDPKDAPSISQGALDGSDPVAVEAVDMLLALVGAQAGNMALQALATGGVYVCGGIPPKLLSRIMQGGLLEAFLYKESRFHSFLSSVPLYVVTNEGLGLLGAQQYAISLLRDL